MIGLRALIRRLRWIHLAPVLAFLALAAWAFASPIGAGPDDDYHLTSTWCAAGGSPECREGATSASREISPALEGISCFAAHKDESAACQEEVLAGWGGDSVESDRGNFVGEYPPLYYAAMHLFAGGDLLVGALAMRLFNALLFVGLATALAVLLPIGRRTSLLWGWLVALVPLGMFIIPSNNPSGWAVTGVGTAFLALIGWFETTGGRRIALGILTGVGVLMAAGSRGDAAVYVAGALLTATIIAGPWGVTGWRSSWRWAWLPAAGILVAAVFFAASGQSGVASSGFGGSGGSVPGSADNPTGGALLAFNLLSLPLLWTGVWGTSALGWMDTGLPEIVSWSAVAAFIAVGFSGIGRMDRRKAVAMAGVFAVLVVLPLWVLTRSGNVVGENLQPRYLLPLIVLFTFILVTTPGGGRLVLTRAQTFVVLFALVLANFVALQVDIRRYVTGADQQRFDLDAGAEWWWTGFPVGPTAVWVIGALAYAGTLAVLWPELRRSQSPAGASSLTDASR